MRVWAVRAYGHALLPHAESYGRPGIYRDTSTIDHEEGGQGTRGIYYQRTSRYTKAIMLVAGQ